MKMIAAMIYQNAEDYIELALRSIMTWADKIILVDGGCRDRTNDIVNFLKDERFVIIKNNWDDNDKGMDGKQRNQYIKYLTEHHIGDWCLVVDSDEVCSDNCVYLNLMCKQMEEQGINVASPHMEHFVYDLLHVDATRDKHYCPHRLFKVQEGIKYPEVEHNVLEVPNIKLAEIDAITLFHLGYIRGLFSVVNRYVKNLKKSNIHNKDYLDKWKNSHIFGVYPTRVYDGVYPKAMCDYFGIENGIRPI